VPGSSVNEAILRHLAMTSWARFVVAIVATDF
jgi:hypothetical protein